MRERVTGLCRSAQEASKAIAELRVLDVARERIGVVGPRGAVLGALGIGRGTFRVGDERRSMIRESGLVSLGAPGPGGVELLAKGGAGFAPEDCLDAVRAEGCERVLEEGGVLLGVRVDSREKRRAVEAVFEGREAIEVVKV